MCVLYEYRMTLCRQGISVCNETTEHRTDERNVEHAVILCEYIYVYRIRCRRMVNSHQFVHHHHPTQWTVNRAVLAIHFWTSVLCIYTLKQIYKQVCVSIYLLLPKGQFVSLKAKCEDWSASLPFHTVQWHNGQPNKRMKQFCIKLCTLPMVFRNWWNEESGVGEWIKAPKESTFGQPAGVSAFRLCHVFTFRTTSYIRLVVSCRSFCTKQERENKNS